MTTSPRKHRGPFRPLDTLSSPQKPTFPIQSTQAGAAPPNSKRNSRRLVLDELDENSSFVESDRDYEQTEPSETDYLGNSSSLFEGDRPEDLRSSPPLIERRTQSTWINNTAKMVREREAPTGQPSQRPEAAAPRPLMDLTGTSPEFGKASPLRNPLHKTASRDKYSHLFNAPKPGQSRPEHHRISDQPPPAFGVEAHGAARQRSRDPTSQSAQEQVSRGPAASTLPTKHNWSNASSGYSNAPSVDSDILEINAAQFKPRDPYQGVQVPKPWAPQTFSVPPAPRPVYSSLGHGNGFQPVNPNFKPHQPLGSRQTTIVSDPFLTHRGARDDEEFDADAAIRAEGQQFGAPDAWAYVESGKAQENIKALLEGAFDEDGEKIPRTRGRKKKRQQEVDKTTKSLAEKLQALEVKDSQDAEENGEQDEEEDDGSVEGMQVKLLPHQVEGVSWMIEKETAAHTKAKWLSKGGILADDMGLGKTVQSIALILSNPRPEKDTKPENPKNVILPAVGKGTLIVAPLALIKQWEAEINSKVTKSQNMRVLVHHGPNRTKSAEKLKGYDVVVTTYQVLASEHASCGEGPDGLQKGCFAVHWYRIILDEAHTIKNRNAKMTKACYDVRSHYRWCLTGTPMQNNLDELQSLIKFLRIKPYCDMPTWKDQITNPMKNGRGNLAMRRLKVVLKTFMKRRTKDVLKKEGALNFGGKSKDGEEKKGFQIVARNIETVIGSFTAQERLFYDRLQSRTENRLAEMMGGEKRDYIGALVLLLRLRQACNHPHLTKSNMQDDKDALTTGSKSNTQSGLQTPRKANNADADDLADLLGGLSVQTKRCDLCQMALTRDNSGSGSIRCNDCESDLFAAQNKAKKHKKHRKHKDLKHKGSKTKADEGGDRPKPSANPRQRRVIVDSDDEDAEGGEWLVPEDEQKTEDLGRAGGTDDEDAEGGGDTLGSIDSDSFATVDDGTPAKKQDDSFIVHDTDSEDNEPVVRHKLVKKKNIISLDSDDDDASSTETETDSSDSHSEGDSEESDSETSEIQYNASDLEPSTKIRQLLAILEKETPDHKVIVFSQFTSMLDLIEPFLRQAGHAYTRYDGGMRNDLREASLHKLRNDKRTRVLLCSLKCGSLGLNLTAASRVVIMEPFWNPFVEEQAIDRVHRLNQTVDVTVYRLSIHNSVEERILELQEAKRKLAAAALEGGKTMGKLGMQEMMNLFKRDAEYDTKNVDDADDRVIFQTRRVLEDHGHGDAGESTARVSKGGRKAGSLGLKRKEDSVWGRR